MFIWDRDPVIFALGPFSLRWYAMAYATAYLGLVYYILPKMFRQTGKPLRYIDDFTFVVGGCGLFLGRFFKGLMYGHLSARQLFFPIYFTPGLSCQLSGFSTRGGLLGGLLGTYLYANYTYISREAFPYISFKKQKRAKVSFAWLTTPFAIGLLTFFSCVRIGNFFNTEIIGTVTQSAHGIFFVKPIKEVLSAKEARIQHIKFYVPKGATANEMHMKMTLRPGLKKEEVDEVITHVQEVAKVDEVAQHIALQGAGLPNHNSDRNHWTVTFAGKACFRHPVQLYESLLGFLVLFLSLWWWFKQRNKPRDGLMGSALLGITQLLRFGTEFYKEKIKVGFHIGDYAVCKSQVYSLFGAIVGLVLFIYLYRKKATTKATVGRHTSNTKHHV